MSTNVLIMLSKSARTLTSCLHIRIKSKCGFGGVPNPSYRRCTAITSSSLALVTRPSKLIVPSSLIKLGKDSFRNYQFVQGMVTRPYKIIVPSSQFRLGKGVCNEHQFILRVVTRLPKTIVLNPSDKIQKKWFRPLIRTE